MEKRKAKSIGMTEKNDRHKIAVSKNEHFEGSSPSLPMPFFFSFPIVSHIIDKPTRASEIS